MNVYIHTYEHTLLHVLYSPDLFGWREKSHRSYHWPGT